MEININSDGFVVHTARLERIKKKSIVFAVKKTLNEIALDVKKNTLEKEASKVFTIRSKNFFKAQSKVIFAKGNNLDSLQSEIGMTETGLKGQRNYSVKHLEKHEKGGNIDKSDLLALPTARKGKSKNELVRPNARLASIKNIVKTKNQQGKTKQQKFVKAVLKAGVGGYVLGSSLKGENYLYKVIQLKSDLNTKTFKPKLIPLYEYVKNRPINSKPKRFAEKAALKSYDSAEKIFEKNIENEIKGIR